MPQPQPSGNEEAALRRFYTAFDKWPQLHRNFCNEYGTVYFLHWREKLKDMPLRTFEQLLRRKLKLTPTDAVVCDDYERNRNGFRSSIR